MSILATVTKEPLNIVTDVMFEFAKYRYTWIINSALGHNTQMTSSSQLIWWTVSITAYAILGFIWTHVKLFLDVWQGSLPKSLDDEVRDLYERKQSYWTFVRKIKWLVVQWGLIFPFSIIYTIARHPLRIVVDFVYELSMRKYTYIIEKAMERRMQKYKEQ